MSRVYKFKFKHNSLVRQKLCLKQLSLLCDPQLIGHFKIVKGVIAECVSARL